MSNCIVCGKQLTGNQRKYCSITCQQEANASKSDKWAYRPKSDRNGAKCVHCGKHLTGRQMMFCSIVCKFNYQTTPSQRRRGISRKRTLIKQLGGKCMICGYAKNSAALNFHHLNDKAYSLSMSTLGQRNLELIEQEAEKCEMLCANCHQNLHNPTLRMSAVQQYLKSTQNVELNIASIQPNGYCVICGKESPTAKGRFCSRKCKNAHYQSYENQKRRGVSRKLELINRLGGECRICGYKDNLAVLVFHHLDRDMKDYELDLRSLANRSLDSLLAEFEKCQLLCANCHAEVHNPDMTLENLASK